MQGRTAIAVAHRLSTVAGMDRLVVLDRGRVVEEGSHAELLAAGRRLRRSCGGGSRAASSAADPGRPPCPESHFRDAMRPESGFQDIRTARGPAPQLLRER